MQKSAKTKRYVSICDPALNVAEMKGSGLQEYAETRDESLLKFKEGEKPTYFHVAPVDVKRFELINQRSATEAEKHRTLFQFAVVKIENVHGMSGNFYETIKPEGENSDGSVKYLEDEQMEEIAPIYIEEIGGAAYQAAFLPPNAKPRLPVSPSLRGIMEGVISQAVAEILKNAQTSNEKQSDQTEK